MHGVMESVSDRPILFPPGGIPIEEMSARLEEEPALYRVILSPRAFRQLIDIEQWIEEEAGVWLLAVILRRGIEVEVAQRGFLLGGRALTLKMYTVPIFHVIRGYRVAKLMRLGGHHGLQTDHLRLYCWFRHSRSGVGGFRICGISGTTNRISAPSVPDHEWLRRCRAAQVRSQDW